MNLTRWNDAIAIVTGASSGIGDAVVRRLAAGGLRVVATARREDRLEALAAELGEDRVRVVPADLRSEADIQRVFAAADAWGDARVLVNNAGLGRYAPLSCGDTEAWREMLEVNVLALCIATREMVSRLHERGGPGHVFHISSMAAHRVPSESGVYSATKFAVRSLTEGLRMELRAMKSPVRVTAISPGYVKTEFAENYHGDPAKAEATYSQYDVLTADDVASAVEYALALPPHAQVHDILMRPTDQPS